MIKFEMTSFGNKIDYFLVLVLVGYLVISPTNYLLSYFLGKVTYLIGRVRLRVDLEVS